MKKFVPTLAGLLVLLALTGTSALAQVGDKAEKGAEKADKADKPHKVAVVDIGHIFQNYGKVKDFGDEFKADQEQVNKDFRAQQEKLVEVVEMLKELKAGSPDYVKKEAEAAKLKTNIETFKMVKNLEFKRRDFQMQQAVHQEIQEAITKVADHYGYTVILQCIRNEGDTNDLKRMSAIMNQPVVWHRKRDDVTDAVLEMLNRRYDKSAAAVTPASGTRPAGKKPAARQAAAE